MRTRIALAVAIVALMSASTRATSYRSPGLLDRSDAVTLRVEFGDPLMPDREAAKPLFPVGSLQRQEFEAKLTAALRTILEEVGISVVTRANVTVVLSFYGGTDDVDGHGRLGTYLLYLYVFEEGVESSPADWERGVIGVAPESDLENSLIRTSLKVVGEELWHRRGERGVRDP